MGFVLECFSLLGRGEQSMSSQPIVDSSCIQNEIINFVDIGIGGLS